MEEKKKPQNEISQSVNEEKVTTIAQLVKKLKDSSYINNDEVDMVKNSLTKATEGMQEGEIAELVGTLDKQFENPNSELRANGFNYKAFEKTVRVITTKIQDEKRIKLEKIEKEKLEEKEKLDFGTEKSNNSEERGLTKEEAKEVAENKEFLISDFFEEFDLKGLLDDETIDEISESMLKVKKHNQLVDELMKNEGLSYDEANKKACQIENRTEDYYQTPKMQIADDAISIQEAEKEAAGKNWTFEQRINNYYKNHPDKAKAKFGDRYEEILSGKATPYEIMKERNLRRTMEIAEKKQEQSFKNASEFMFKKEYFDISDLKIEFEFLEKQERKRLQASDRLKRFREKIGKKVKDEDGNEIDRKDVFEKLKNEYLTTEQSVSDIYNKYMYTELEGMTFEEALQGIQKSIKRNGNGIWNEENLKTMMRDERKIRITDRVMEACRYMNEDVEPGQVAKYNSPINLAKLNRYLADKDKRKEDSQDLKAEFLKLEKKPLEEIKRNIFNKTTNDKKEYEAKFYEQIRETSSARTEELQAEELQTEEGQMINAAALAEKNGVTNSKMKTAMDKLKNLFRIKSSSKGSQEQAQTVQSVEDEEITQ